MPMYEFQCEECDVTKDVIVTLTDMDEGRMPYCPSCGRDMERVPRVYANGHVFKGKWYKTSGDY